MALFLFSIIGVLIGLLLPAGRPAPTEIDKG
jgi:hypothetical protein